MAPLTVGAWLVAAAATAAAAGIPLTARVRRWRIRRKLRKLGPCVPLFASASAGDPR